MPSDASNPEDWNPQDPRGAMRQQAGAVPAPLLSTHAAAAADFLDHIAKQLRHGTAPEDIGRQVSWIGAMMERRI